LLQIREDDEVKYIVFTYPLPHHGELEDLNQFLSSHRVLSTSKSFIQRHQSASLVFLIEYCDDGKTSDFERQNRGERVDYKKLLSSSQYILFSRLRDLRKLIAAEEGIPVFAVFTNSQLAEMVQKEVRDLKALKGISGLGTMRIQKHGDRLLEILCDIEAAPAGNCVPPPAQGE
jgi:superfamily II DNA helicase RecQ